MASTADAPNLGSLAFSTSAEVEVFLQSACETVEAQAFKRWGVRRSRTENGNVGAGGRNRERRRVDGQWNRVAGGLQACWQAKGAGRKGQTVD